MIISKSHKFIFVHLEKCGGTSVESALSTVLSDDDILLGSTEEADNRDSENFKKYGIHKVKNDMLWKHSTARQAYRYLGYNQWKNYKRLSVVRDPVGLGRSLFAFSEKIVAYHLKQEDMRGWRAMVKRNGFPDHWPYAEEYVQSYITSVVNKSRFDGFIDDLIRKDRNCFSPYSERLKPSYFNPDFGMVVDLSQLNNRWPEVCDYLGVKNIPLEQLNTSNSGVLNISNSSIEKIKERFAIDYEIIPQYTGVYWN